MWIKNAQQILSNAKNQRNKELRQSALTIIDEMVSQLQPNVLLERMLHRTGNRLYIGQSVIELTDFDEFLVVGGGKAALGMTTPLVTCLHDKVLKGLLSIPHGMLSKPEFSSEIVFQEASHPIPDLRGAKATRKMVNLLKDANDRTLVFFLISGGGSALMPLPANGISLDAKLETNRLLLESGANIMEVNAVRKHCSAWKGGQAAKLAYPATVVSLILSDVIGDPLDVIASGPTVPDKSTFLDAFNILQKYRMWNKVDHSIRKRIRQGLRGIIPDTPKEGEIVFQRVLTEIIGNNRTATNIIANIGQSLGYQTLILTNFLQGEAKEVGRVIGAIARQVEYSSGTFAKFGLIILGGETTVTVFGNGKGGRNQELALSCSQLLSGTNEVAVVAFGTDGIDGISKAAGAIVDGMTAQRVSDMGLNIEDSLQQNDSGTVFKKIGDQILTGYTGTNVADVVLIISHH
ncbi:MAG: glycerate kinase [Candidatus Hodarchaeota archaeon]